MRCLHECVCVCDPSFQVLGFARMTAAGAGRASRVTSRSADPADLDEQPLVDPSFTHMVVGIGHREGGFEGNGVEDLGKVLGFRL